MIYCEGEQKNGAVAEREQELEKVFVFYFLSERYLCVGVIIFWKRRN